MYQYYSGEKHAENEKIENNGSKIIHDHPSIFDLNINGTTSSDNQRDYNTNHIDYASFSSSDNRREHDSNYVNDTSDNPSEHNSNEAVKDADLTVFINLDDNFYEDDPENDTISSEIITSKPNETTFENSQTGDIFNSLKKNETSQSKPVKDESLKESTRSELSYQKYQVTYVPVKYYPTKPTIPVPSKTFGLSINSETYFNKLFHSRFQLQFTRPPPMDKVINNNNNNGNINYYNSYFANNHFKVPSLLRIPAIVAERIKKKGAAFFGGLADFYNA